jgi:ABC-2 type transport system permease protein
MTLLATERIKLFTTRSPWLTSVLALALVAGFAVLVATNSVDPRSTTDSDALAGYQFGLMVVMVMAALAVTTEYRFGTIRASFQAVPNRIGLLLAKATVVALLAGVVGEIAAFGSIGLAKAISPNSGVALHTAQEWRNVAGVGLVFALAAVLAVAVGILVRQTAGAVAILLIYTLLVENLIVLIPHIGPAVQKWLPFISVNHFLTGGGSGGRISGPLDMPLPPWGSLAYFAGIAVAFLAVALVTVNRRDA